MHWLIRPSSCMTARARWSVRTTTGETTQIGGLITEDQFLEIHATGIPPTSDEESGIVATLDPGAYRQLSPGADSSTGIGLAEVSDVGPAAAAASWPTSARAASSRQATT